MDHFFKEGDIPEAKKLYKIAINLKPNYLEAQNSLGNKLYHRTIPFSSNQERIIISLNLLPDGFLPNYS